MLRDVRREERLAKPHSRSSEYDIVQPLRHHTVVTIRVFYENLAVPCLQTQVHVACVRTVARMRMRASCTHLRMYHSNAMAWMYVWMGVCVG